MRYTYSHEHLDHEGNYNSCIHRFKPDEANAPPILLIHGSIEDSRIFYSSSGKGYAPFLAKNGFDVFVPDLPGKGKSRPSAAKNFKHGQKDFIDKDLNDYLNYIRKIHGEKPIRMGAHSWGGVLILAWYAKYGSGQKIGPMTFFGSKRRVGVIGLRRFFVLDLMWSGVGTLSTALSGYLPAKKLGFGSENEPADFYRETNKWVYSKNWIDPESEDNIAERLKTLDLPPILFFSAIKDFVLGHPRDVERLMQETGSESASHLLLAKHLGNLKDYNHIDMLTAPECPEDHFRLAVHWLKTGNLK